MRQFRLSRTIPIEAIHVWPPNFGGYVLTNDVERAAKIKIIAAADAQASRTSSKSHLC